MDKVKEQHQKTSRKIIKNKNCYWPIKTATVSLNMMTHKVYISNTITNVKKNFNTK